MGIHTAFLLLAMPKTRALAARSVDFERGSQWDGEALYSVKADNEASLL